ncbi:MAG: 16S rRNA (uracil(1498)-N(3))-methyltransferase [Bacteroidota bacterium]
MHFFYIPDIDLDQPVLPEEEAKHAMKVLRMGIGSKLRITNGKGLMLNAEISETTSKSCKLTIIDSEQVPKPSPERWLAVAPTKNADRLEWLVEKATELGVTGIVPILCERSERKVQKTDRLEKIAIAALKQSQQAWLPQIPEPIVFQKFLDQGFKGNGYIAHCIEGHKRKLAQLYSFGESATVFIGPEGDFTPEEVKAALAKDCHPVSLGTNRLRTETAALFALTVLVTIDQI